MLLDDDAIVDVLVAVIGWIVTKECERIKGPFGNQRRPIFTVAYSPFYIYHSYIIAVDGSFLSQLLLAYPR
jgi:hypothetical protein